MDARGGGALEDATRGLSGVARSPVTSPIPATVRARSRPPVTGSTRREQRQPARPEPAARTGRLRAGRAARGLRGERVRPARADPARAPPLREGAAVVNVTSDAGVEAYEGWGGYGSSKAALEQLTAILAAEHPTCGSTGSTRATCAPRCTRTRSRARTSPTVRCRESVPGLLALIEGELPSGRYLASDPALLPWGRVIAAAVLTPPTGPSPPSCRRPSRRKRAAGPRRRAAAGQRRARRRAVEHAAFRDLPRLLVPGDLLVVNASATIPAALAAWREAGRRAASVDAASREARRGSSSCAPSTRGAPRRC